MIRRPLHLLVWGMLAVATTILPAHAEEDRAPRLRRSNEATGSRPTVPAAGNRGASTNRPQLNRGNNAQPGAGAAPRSLPAPVNRDAGAGIRERLQQRVPQPAAVTPTNPAPRSLPTRPSNEGRGNPTLPSRASLPETGLRIPNNPANNNNSRPGNEPGSRVMPRTGGIQLPNNRNPGVVNPGIQPRSESPRLPTGRPAVENPPATGRPGAEGGSQFRERLEQLRNQSPNTRPGTSNSPQQSPTGNTDVQRLRERLESIQKNDRPVPAPSSTNLPGRGNVAPADSVNGDLLRERLKERTNGVGNARPGTVPGERPSRETGRPELSLPNLDALRDRVDTRKPELGAPGKTDVEQLRDRLKSTREGGAGLPRLPSQPDGKGEDIDLNRPRGPRPDLKIERNVLNQFPRQGGTRPEGRGEGQRPPGERSNPQLDFVRRLEGQQRHHPGQFRNAEELRKGLEHFRQQPEVKTVLTNTNLKLNDFSGAFQTRLHQRGGDFRGNDFGHIVQTNYGRRFDLDRQFNLFSRGDITRQLNLNVALVNHGGWARRPMGPIYSRYTSSHFSSWYPGPSWYPNYCWTPNWTPWVRWSFWDYCSPIYDPRPLFCRPVYYFDPCPPLVTYQYPVWQPLPVVSCGTWLDVPVTLVPQADLQLLAVRFVDPGHPQENLGPRYRVWLRNNSQQPIQSPFNVMLMASNSDVMGAGMPEAGITVEGMDGEGVIPVDVRLPMDANRIGQGNDGQRIPFSRLHVLVDSHQQLAEVDESNNGLVIDRGEILPVDPAAFSTEEPVTGPGAMVSLAGEGFGPEPGQLIVTVGPVQVPAEVYGWYDLGVYFKMPNIPATTAAKAELLVIRGDGAASNPVAVELR